MDFDGNRMKVVPVSIGFASRSPPLNRISFIALNIGVKCYPNSLGLPVRLVGANATLISCSNQSEIMYLSRCLEVYGKA